MITEQTDDAGYLRARYLAWRRDDIPAATALKWARAALEAHRFVEKYAALGLRRYCHWSIYKGAFFASWRLEAEAHGVPGVSSLDQPCVYIDDDLEPFRRCQMFGYDMTTGAERWFWVSLRRGAVVCKPCAEPAWARKRREEATRA